LPLLLAVKTQEFKNFSNYFMTQQRVAIITDKPGWHGHCLSQAFATHDIDTCFVALSDCAFDLSASPPSIILPYFGSKLPDGVIVRGISGGSFEQITFRLGILHALRESGVPVYNDAHAIERTVDKSMTSFLMRRAGIPTPPTWVCENREQALHIMHAAFARGEELVMKPLFGSQGQGLIRLQYDDDLPNFNGVFYLQTYVPTQFIDKKSVDMSIEQPHLYCDWRVFVIGGLAHAIMLRYHHYWVTNRAQGATCKAVALDPELTTLAEAAAAVVGVDYAGIDIIRDSTGQLQVLEVNGIPAWQGLQSVCTQDLAQCIVDDFVQRKLVKRARHATALS
jgi:RimK family alpha-L-glutamate ligase